MTTYKKEIEVQFAKDIRNYLNELDDQSPIISTSHITLIRLAEKYGKEKVRRAIELKTLKKVK